MARQSISDSEAFTILVRASQRENRKLRDVAADLAGVNSNRAEDAERRPRSRAARRSTDVGEG